MNSTVGGEPRLSSTAIELFSREMQEKTQLHAESENFHEGSGSQEREGVGQE